MLTRRCLIARRQRRASAAAGRSRRTNRSWWPRPPRRRIPACSAIILPLFKAKTGIDVKVVAQGTGQALDTGRRGDADVVFVHAKSAEEKFLAEGFGVKRYPVMYNDFVLIGPKSDPAGIKGIKDIVAALKAIKDKGAPFISRGDKSGTHIAELDLWKVAGIDIAEGQGRLVQGDRPGHGRRAQHRVGVQRLRAGRPRHLALVQEQGRPRHRGGRRQAAVQPVRRHAGEPGRSIRT